jgi:mannose-1-phosphate guanylyltransferase
MNFHFHQSEKEGVRAFAKPANRWGIVLAGGDGVRLKNLTRIICGDDRPKQFCPLVGADTLLEQTRKRAERCIASERFLFLLAESHSDFYLKEQGIHLSRRVVQPANKGTAPPILYGLLSIEQLDKDAIVAILPCDHHYSNEYAFTGALENAFAIAAQRSDSIVLLGAPPQGPEIEYGWIELGRLMGSALGASFHVQRFWEKPSLQVARNLIERGSLWNTFVMVGHIRSFLAMTNEALPDVMAVLRNGPLWAGSEVHVPDSLYAQVRSTDFSRQVLAPQAGRLAALRLDHAGWSDLGHPERVLAVLQAERMEPWWMKQWKSTRTAADPCARQSAIA